MIIDSSIKLFTGNANPKLAQRIADNLDMELGKAYVGRFSDGEVAVEIIDNVRGLDVYIIQSTCIPTADNFMELLVMIDAVKRASCNSVTAVMPYFGYARQDRRPKNTRVPITAKVAAKMIQAMGVNRVLTIDLHADQIQGFFDIPVDNVYASRITLRDMNEKYKDNPEIVVVSPDIGGVVRARAIAKRLGCDLAIIDKRRPKANMAKVMNIIGEIENKTCILVDDMIDTAGTLCAASTALSERGAKEVVAYCVHPILSGNAIDNIKKSALTEVVVTDTIPLRENAKQCKKIRQLSVADMLAKTIKRIANRESVSEMYVD